MGLFLSGCGGGGCLWWELRGRKEGSSGKRGARNEWRKGKLAKGRDALWQANHQIDRERTIN